jgi:hypothetical protein
MDSSLVSKALKRAFWLAFWVAVACCVFVYRGNITAIVKYQVTSPTAKSLAAKASYGVDGIIQTVNGNEFVVKLDTGGGAPSTGDIFYTCTMGESVLVDIREDAVTPIGGSPNKKIMDTASAMELIVPGRAVSVAGQKAGDGQISSVTRMTVIMQGGFDDKYVDPDPGYVDIMTSKTTKHPKWMYRRQ